MLRRAVILLVLAWLGSSFALASDIKPLMDDTISPQMTETVPLVADSLLMHSQIAEVPLVADSIDVDDKDAWKRKIFRHGWSINDTTIKYPPVLDFGVKTYRWLNHALNYYDTTYVVNPGKTSGKKWKIMIKNNNWLDFYSGHLTTKRTYLQLNSDITSLFGFQICGMGLSFTYMINARDLLAGKFIRNRRLQFSFTTSRIFIEAYYRKNENSTVHLHWLGAWHGDEIFPGLKREGYGLDAYYIFNHTHYSQAAAYCFSKYQKRSSGSLLAGIYLSHQDVVMDMSVLSPKLRRYLPNSDTDYRFRYRDFGFLVGYGYSWVFHHGWLYNITFAPSFGYRHSFPNSIEGKKGLFSTNITAKMALVRTAGNFFYAFNFNHEDTGTIVGCTVSIIVTATLNSLPVSASKPHLPV